MGRTRHYPMARVARRATVAGVAHVAVSLLLGGVIVAIGLQFRSVVEGAQSVVIGCVLLATGLGFGAVELRGRANRQEHPRGCRHDDPPGDHGREPDRPAAGARTRGLAAVVVPFGAAASPDLTILPVFVAATAIGVVASIAALAVFSVVTIATIVALTCVAAFGGYQVQGRWLDRWGTALTAVVLVVVGGLVLSGVV
jgi:nickel/cobalt exporter